MQHVESCSRGALRKRRGTAGGGESRLWAQQAHMRWSFLISLLGDSRLLSRQHGDCLSLRCCKLHVTCGWLSQLKRVLYKGLVVQIAWRW